MLDNATLASLNALKLFGFAEGLQEQKAQPEMLAMTFEERLALLIDREMHARNDRKRARLVQRARLKVPGACIEDADFAGIRGLDRRTLTTLALSELETRILNAGNHALEIERRLFDMLRGELHPNGAFNVTEFGTVKDRRQFEALFVSMAHTTADIDATIAAAREALA